MTCNNFERVKNGVRFCKHCGYARLLHRHVLRQCECCLRWFRGTGKRCPQTCSALAQARAIGGGR